MIGRRGLRRFPLGGKEGEELGKVARIGLYGMGRRAALEAHRAAILTTAGTALGIPPHTVTLEALSQLLQPAQATVAAERSARLRGLLAEVTREHAINRALMRQELAFLDHLMRELGGELDTGYAPPANGAGRSTPRAPFRTLDLEA